MNLSILESDANHVLFSQSNVLVTVWQGVQEPDACRHLYDAALKLARTTHASKIAALSVVMHATGAPSLATREALALLHEDPQEVIHRSALVFARSGFVASIIRSVVLNLRQRASRRDGHGIFSGAAEALDWVVEGLPMSNFQSSDKLAILRQIDELSARKSMVA